jgi:hypothetical protein
MLNPCFGGVACGRFLTPNAPKRNAGDWNVKKRNGEKERKLNAAGEQKQNEGNVKKQNEGDASARKRNGEHAEQLEPEHFVNTRCDSLM